MFPPPPVAHAGAVPKKGLGTRADVEGDICTLLLSVVTTPTFFSGSYNALSRALS